MKQRARIRRIKENTYKYYIYMWTIKRRWRSIKEEMRKLSDEMRKVYENSREEHAPTQ